ncbi:hypothetical protein CsSME_00011794 [Camellia sinensis var. sinensis]
MASDSSTGSLAALSLATPSKIPQLPYMNRRCEGVIGNTARPSSTNLGFLQVSILEMLIIEAGCESEY